MANQPHRPSHLHPHPWLILGSTRPIVPRPPPQAPAQARPLIRLPLYREFKPTTQPHQPPQSRPTTTAVSTSQVDHKNTKKQIEKIMIAGHSQGAMMKLISSSPGPAATKNTDLELKGSTSINAEATSSLPIKYSFINYNVQSINHSILVNTSRTPNGHV